MTGRGSAAAHVHGEVDLAECLAGVGWAEEAFFEDTARTAAFEDAVRRKFARRDVNAAISVLVAARYEEVSVPVRWASAGWADEVFIAGWRWGETTVDLEAWRGLVRGLA